MRTTIYVVLDLLTGLSYVGRSGDALKALEGTWNLESSGKGSWRSASLQERIDSEPTPAWFPAYEVAVVNHSEEAAYHAAAIDLFDSRQNGFNHSRPAVSVTSEVRDDLTHRIQGGPVKGIYLDLHPEGYGWQWWIGPATATERDVLSAWVDAEQGQIRRLANEVTNRPWEDEMRRLRQIAGNRRDRRIRYEDGKKIMSM